MLYSSIRSEDTHQNICELHVMLPQLLIGVRLHAGSEDAGAPGAGPVTGSDFYTAEEMAAMLKPKKKKLVRPCNHPYPLLL